MPTSADSIAFILPGSGVHTIAPASTLPDIVAPLTIDGTTQPGYAGTPVIEVDGTNAGASVVGLHFKAGADGSSVVGLVIDGFKDKGISFDNCGQNSVRAC